MGSQSRRGGDLGFGGKEAGTLHGPVVRGGLETLIQNPATSQSQIWPTIQLCIVQGARFGA